MLKDLFGKKKTYTKNSRKAKHDIPEGIMNKCVKCSHIQYSKELEQNLMVCSNCDHHFRLNARQRIEITLDDATLNEFDAEMVSVDPLDFPGYKESLNKYQCNTGFRDAVVTGEGQINGLPVVVAMMSFEFFGGSMGSVVGEKVTRAIETATKRKLPLIIFSTSGGARMQESILSLMQMAKTSAALTKFHEQGGLFISVLTDPTFGGVPASFAMLGDFIIAEPGTSFGFTGRRVIEQAIRQKLPDNFQTAEFNLKHGQLDKIVHRKQMKQTLSKIIELHQGEGGYV